ncbi:MULTISPECIES: heme exporter protein CcmD [Lichenihabitans]|uniref:heme exporter protein CcmD n=1 Tax=Lichenihabitans TaxID=2723776 RepID=UPI001479062E|nr:MULTISPECIES: heme exporter protein CcmD [Lichenihabitans]UDL93365.1 heme exporter protein CcmD [Lichenihabitans sp. PAMC28606]
MDQPVDMHVGFIVAAFVITGLVLSGTLAAVLLDYRAQLRALARLGRPAGKDLDA